MSPNGLTIAIYFYLNEYEEKLNRWWLNSKSKAITKRKEGIDMSREFCRRIYKWKMSLDTYFCICCLSTDDLSHLIDKNYSTMLQELFLIKPFEADDENYICVDCATKLMECYEFRQHIHNSLKTLQILGLINLGMDRNNLVIQRITNSNENEEANINNSINLNTEISKEISTQEEVEHRAQTSITTFSLIKLNDDTTRLNLDDTQRTDFCNIVVDNVERTHLSNTEADNLERTHLSNTVAGNLEKANLSNREPDNIRRINLSNIVADNLERTHISNIEPDNLVRTHHRNIELDNIESTNLENFTSTKRKKMKEENVEVFMKETEKTVQPFPSSEFASLSEGDGGSSGNYSYEVTEDLSCKFCQWTAPNVYCFHLHMNKHFPNHVCEVCGKGFVTATRLKRHKYTHEKGPYVCPECGKVYSNYNTFSDHKSRHYAKRKYGCRICSESFQSLHARLRHSAEVHDQAQAYSCEQCPKKFSTTGLLNSHVRYTHLKVRRHQCQVCLAAFCNKQDLDGHMTSHTGHKPFSCDVCGNCYSHKKALRVHQQKHTDTKRFACNICGKRFLQKITLNYHLKTHKKKQKPEGCGEI